MEGVLKEKWIWLIDIYFDAKQRSSQNIHIAGESIGYLYVYDRFHTIVNNRSNILDTLVQLGITSIEIEETVHI